MNLLWTQNGNSIHDPDGEIEVIVLGDKDNKSFTRALCHVLNSTPDHKLSRDHEEMDMRGVPR